MADDPNRQRLEDMLKASEQRRTPGAGAQTEGSGEPGRSSDRSSADVPGGGEGEGGGRSSRATGSTGKLAVAGLITGGLSIPGALIAILGLVLAIAAIVLGVVVSRRSTDLRAKIAIGLGTLGVILSIVSGVIGVIAFSEQSGDDSEESDGGDGGDDGEGGDDGDGDGDSGDGDSSSLPAPFAIAVTLHGERILTGGPRRSGRG